jgi:hypothetical protein
LFYALANVWLKMLEQVVTYEMAGLVGQAAQNGHVGRPIMLSKLNNSTALELVEQTWTS